MIYSVTYWSALDCALLRKGIDLLPQTIDTWVAPSSMCLEQVEQAFLRQYPGCRIESLVPLPAISKLIHDQHA